jgi:cytolysin-activating lysine-acyltransferase
MADTPIKTTGQGPEAKKTVSQVLGEITWLLTQSPIHKQLFIGDLEWFVMPSILLEQFRIFNGPQHPVAFALWARVSKETEERLEAGAHKLRPDEWKGGDRAWIIEVVAPFGGQDEILADMAEHIFAHETFKYHSVNEAGQRVVIEHGSQKAVDPTVN